MPVTLILERQSWVKIGVKVAFSSVIVVVFMQPQRLKIGYYNVYPSV